MNAKSQLFLSTALLSASLAVTGIQPGFAQDADDESAIEEVLVTATRRGATDIQTTPVAVTAVSGADVDRMSPRDLGEIAFLVPNFTNGQTAGFNSASYGIRGVGQTDIIVYLDSPVGVTIDDFVVPHIQSQNLEMFDIEAIEILRGPQGTLFGKNTTGGVINVRTKRPELGDTSVEARMKYGSFDTKEGKFAVNVGAGEEFAFRVAGMYLQSDGFYKNNAAYGPVVGPPAYFGMTGQGDGRDLGGDDLFSARAKLLWQPSNNTSLLFQYEIVRDNADSAPVFNDSPANAVFPALGFIGEAGDPVEQAGMTDRPGFIVDPGGKGHKVDIDGFYAAFEWDQGSFAVNMNVGFRHQESRLASNYTGEVFVTLFDATRDDKRDTFQQEIRVATNFDGPLNYVAGMFFQSNNTSFCVTQALGFLDLFGIVLPFGTFTDNPQIMCNRQEAEAFAGFVDGTYEVNDRLSISAGFRYTLEKKEWAGRHQIFIQALGGGWDPALNEATLGDPLVGADFDLYPYGVVRDSQSWNEPNYRLTVDYEVSDDLFTYATFSHGFRSGNYNDQTGTAGLAIPEAAARPTSPEFADSFEVGLKGSNADGSLRFSIAGFMVKYKDAQRSAVITTTNSFGETFQETRFFNAAKLDVKGIEIEATWSPMPALMLRGSLGYLDGNYDKFEIDGDFDGVVDVDLSDRPLTKAPELQLALDAVYTHDMGDTGSLEFAGNVFYEDESIYNYSDMGADFDTVLNSKVLLNASVTYSDSNDQYFVRFIGKNLSDKRYKTGSLPVADLWVMTSYGQPRFLGAEIGFKFGM